VNGGAIALGHPLVVLELNYLFSYSTKRRGSKYGIVSMCVGTGQGSAGVYELCKQILNKNILKNKKMADTIEKRNRGGQFLKKQNVKIFSHLKILQKSN
jgi:hypothetical protein